MNTIRLCVLFTQFMLIKFTYGQVEMPNTLSNTDKVYGLSKFWQEVNYNFIYLDKVDRIKWENDYKALLSEVQETENDYAYYLLLKKFCASLKDGHTNVYFPDEIYDNLLNAEFGDYKFRLTNIDQKAIVTRINASKREEIPIGTEVINVNGLSTQDYINKHVKPYISSSTEHILNDWSISMMLKALVGHRFEITFQLPSGEKKMMNLVLSETSEKEMIPPIKKRELLEFKWVDKEIAYVALNSFDDRRIDSLFQGKLSELANAKRLIIDLRNNGGGNTHIGLAILQYLTRDTVLYGSKWQSRLHIPSYKAWGMWVEESDTTADESAKKAFLSYKDEYFTPYHAEPDTVKPTNVSIVVPTVVLIGHHTASAAEDFLIYTDNQPHMIKMGTPTFGSTGQPMLFDLPGGGSARICTKKDVYPNGKVFVGKGILPDISVPFTLKDYIENNDPALTAAIEYLKGKK